MSDWVSVFDVFTPTTQARINFVERPSISTALVRSLRTPGMQIIVYGETGSGKSTILQKKLEETYPAHVTTRCTSGMTFDQIVLNAFDQLGPHYLGEYESTKSTGIGASISAEFLGIRSAIEASQEKEGRVAWTRVVPPQLTVQRLGQFLGAAGRCWLVEDFHKVEVDQKRHLAQALKVFSDLAAEYNDLRVIAVGATDRAREVVQYDPEMRNRVAEIEVPLMSDDELSQIIQGGARLLRVDMDELTGPIIRYSMGVAAVTHQLALNACLNSGIEWTQADVYVLPGSSLDASLLTWVSESGDTVKARFDSALRRHRVRRYDNTRLILSALADGPLEGMLSSELLASVKQTEPDYPAGNLTKYLRQLLTDARGAMVITTADGRYRFVDPLHHTYAKVVLREAPRVRDSTDEPIESEVLVALTEELKRVLDSWRTDRPNAAGH
jgi:hypothetical protein